MRASQSRSSALFSEFLSAVLQLEPCGDPQIRSERPDPHTSLSSGRHPDVASGHHAPSAASRDRQSPQPQARPIPSRSRRCRSSSGRPEHHVLDRALPGRRDPEGPIGDLPLARLHETAADGSVGERPAHGPERGDLAGVPGL